MPAYFINVSTGLQASGYDSNCKLYLYRFYVLKSLVDALFIDCLLCFIQRDHFTSELKYFLELMRPIRLIFLRPCTRFGLG